MNYTLHIPHPFLFFLFSDWRYVPQCSINVFSRIWLMFILLIQPQLKFLDTQRPRDWWKHISTAFYSLFQTKLQNIPMCPLCAFYFFIQRLKQIWCFCPPLWRQSQRSFFTLCVSVSNEKACRHYEKGRAWLTVMAGNWYTCPLRPPQWARPSSFSRNTEEQIGTFFQIGETYQELHKCHTVKHVNLTTQGKAGNVMPWELQLASF